MPDGWPARLSPSLPRLIADVGSIRVEMRADPGVMRAGRAGGDGGRVRRSRVRAGHVWGGRRRAVAAGRSAR